jgi:hypothetical protein
MGRSEGTGLLASTGSLLYLPLIKFSRTETSPPSGHAQRGLRDASLTRYRSSSIALTSPHVAPFRGTTRTGGLRKTPKATHPPPASSSSAPNTDNKSGSGPEKRGVDS